MLSEIERQALDFAAYPRYEVVMHDERKSAIPSVSEEDKERYKTILKKAILRFSIWLTKNESRTERPLSIRHRSKFSIEKDLGGVFYNMLKLEISH